MHRPALLAALLVVAGAAPSQARSKVHVWTDQDGVVHVDDTPPDVPVRRRSRANVGTTAGPVAAAPAEPRVERKARWWQRTTDAPPDEIDRAARLYNIPAELVRAVIYVESAGQADAVSNKGAIGLMQLMPHTAGEMFVQDAQDPAQNIYGGTRYLRILANQFNGDMLLTIAAYNAGPEAVRKYRGVPPFAETRDYVRKVMARYGDLKRESEKTRKLASAADPAKAGTHP